jgi:hypothetical protein
VIDSQKSTAVIALDKLKIRMPIPCGRSSARLTTTAIKALIANIARTPQNPIHCLGVGFRMTNPSHENSSCPAWRKLSNCFSAARM